MTVTNDPDYYATLGDALREAASHFHNCVELECTDAYWHDLLTSFAIRADELLEQRDLAVRAANH